MRWMPIAALLLAAALAPGRAAMAGDEARNVLVLYANARLLPANAEIDAGLRKTLRTSQDRSATVFDEFLDEPRFEGPAFERTVITYLNRKYAARPPRVLIAVGNEALTFVLRNRAALFPSAPLIYVAVSRSFLRSLPPLPADVVGVPMELNVSATIDQAQRWHPQLRRIVIVTGASPRDREFESEVREELGRTKPRATVEFLAGLPTAALLKRLGDLGGDDAVYTTGFLQDGEGREALPRDTVREMAAVSKAPLYVSFDTMLGTGAVGGYMARFGALGRQGGEIARALLEGAAPGSLRLPEVMPATLNVDWRQLQRWGFDDEATPAGAIVHFKPPALLEAYRREVVGALAVCLMQAGMIAWLLFERRRRRRAEGAVEQQRFQLAHALRLQIAAQLTGSIAHEINQPLGAILSNADAADMILESSADRRSELRQILADIRRDDLRASKVIERLRGLLAKQKGKPVLMEAGELLREVESLLVTEARRRGVALEIQPARASLPVVGDRVQLQQVLINLVLNAMDAVADLPESRRTVTLSAEGFSGGVAIQVRDRGPGIAPESLPKLFEPFFTTKRNGMGLGLAISRDIVEVHGGRLRAGNGEGGGAVFRVELPASGAEGTMPARPS